MPKSLVNELAPWAAGTSAQPPDRLAEFCSRMRLLTFVPEGHVSTVWLPSWLMMGLPPTKLTVSGNISLAQAITGLNPNSTYLFRIVAENQGRVVYGQSVECITLNPDTDNDGLNDSDEITKYHTNPTDSDV